MQRSHAFSPSFFSSFFFLLSLFFLTCFTWTNPTSFFFLGSNLLLDMVYFKDISSSDKKYLIISKDQDDATEKGLSLLVEKPVIGRFSPIWPKQNDFGDIVEWTHDTSQNPNSPSRAWSLHTSLHKNTTESGPLRTLGHRIISSETRWGKIFRTNGEFGYTPYYWEWLEDVLSCSKKTLIKA